MAIAATHAEDLRARERRNSSPPFEIGGVVFECFVTADGQGYVWRSTCGRFAAGCVGATYVARAHGTVLKQRYARLMDAMAAAITQPRK